jgi:hypothetical protein
MGAVGILAASLPDLAATWFGTDKIIALRSMFGLYGASGLATFLLCRPPSVAVEAPAIADVSKRPLVASRSIVYQLAALFSVDAFGSGFFVQSLLALWLFQVFHLSVLVTSTILFWSSMCSAISFLVAVPISQRFGLINTMVFTHLPSNLFLMLVPFAPDLATVIGLLLARNALSQMDVPARSSYVMAVVTPEERPAAASVTSVPEASPLP